MPRPPRKGFVETDGVVKDDTNAEGKKTRPAKSNVLTRSNSFGRSWGGSGSSGGVAGRSRKAAGVDADGNNSGGGGVPPSGTKINGAAPAPAVNNDPSLPPPVGGGSNNHNDSNDVKPAKHRKKLSRVPLFASSSLPSSPSSSPQGGGEIGFGWGKKLGGRRSSAADASPGRRGFGRGISGGGGGGRGRGGGRGGNAAAAAAAGLRPGDGGEGEGMKYTKSMAHAMAFAPDEDDVTVSAYTEDRHDSERQHAHPHEVGLIDFDDEGRSGVSMCTPTPSHLSVGSVWSRHSALTADSATRSEVGVEEMEVGKTEVELVGHSCDGDSVTDREIFEGLGLGEEDGGRDENQRPGEGENASKMDGASAQGAGEEGAPPRYSPLAKPATTMQQVQLPPPPPPPPYSASAAAGPSARPTATDVRGISDTTGSLSSYHAVSVKLSALLLLNSYRNETFIFIVTECTVFRVCDLFELILRELRGYFKFFVLFCAALCCAVLFCSVLFCAVLCCAVPCCVVPYRALL